MSDIKTEIKPCPFCGSMPHLYIWEYSEYWTVNCSNTDCIANAIQRNRWSSMETAVEKWNKRINN